MKKKYVAFLREQYSLRELAINDAGKPPVDSPFARQWQSVIELIATEANEPVAQILRVRQDSIRDLAQGDGADPGVSDAPYENGLYCEFELGKSGLLITNKAADDPQDDAPADAPAVTTCFGLPILWPDEALFGVICVPNSTGKVLKPSYRNILAGLRATIEQELILLLKQKQAPPPPAAAAETDALTSVYSRGKIEDILKHEFERARRYLKTFSITMIDLTGSPGAAASAAAKDELLKAFAKSIGSKIRETDFWGRWSGDAFILVCPYADTVETQQMFARIRPSVCRDMKAAAGFSDFSFGVSQYEPDDLTYPAIVKRAEENLEQYKEMLRRRSAAASDLKNAHTR